MFIGIRTYKNGTLMACGHTFCKEYKTLRGAQNKMSRHGFEGYATVEAWEGGA